MSSLTVTETTIADLAGLRMGVANIWEDEFKGPDGKSKRGPTAMLSIIDDKGTTLLRERVHPGSEVEAQRHRFRIESINAPENALGSITILEIKSDGAK